MRKPNECAVHCCISVASLHHCIRSAWNRRPPELALRTAISSSPPLTASLAVAERFSCFVSAVSDSIRCYTFSQRTASAPKADRSATVGSSKHRSAAQRSIHLDEGQVAVLVAPTGDVQATIERCDGGRRAMESVAAEARLKARSRDRYAQLSFEGLATVAVGITQCYERCKEALQSAVDSAICWHSYSHALGWAGLRASAPVTQPSSL